MKHIKILDIFYGNKCNLACMHCDTRSNSLSGVDPDIDNIKESIRLANNKFDVENWSVLGGEPLLYKDTVIEIIKYLRSIEPNKTIFFPTNGLLLEKNIEFVADLIKNYRVWVQVCNHTAKFDIVKKQNIQRSIKEIAHLAKLPQLDPVYNWWYSIMKFESGTSNWLEFVEKKRIDITDTTPDSIGFMQDNYGIHYMESHEFQRIYNLVDSKPMPYNSKDPSESYWNSCPSLFCAFLHDKKVYKCAALGTLHNFLETKEMLEEEQWQKYLNYKPVDLENCTEKEVEHFGNTHYCHIDECSMCPNKALPIEKTEFNVLRKYNK